jgi:dolichol kinase
MQVEVRTESRERLSEIEDDYCRRCQEHLSVRILMTVCLISAFRHDPEPIALYIGCAASVVDIKAALTPKAAATPFREAGSQFCGLFSLQA